MKKLLMGIFGFAFVSCMAMGASLYNANVNASAEVVGSGIFTETKCKISNDGERMLVVTGIKDVSLIYELGYEINGEEYDAKAGDTAQTDTYYESLTLGSVTKTANEFIEGAQGLLVWEIDYDSTIAYSVKAYAYVGELNDKGQLIAPDQNQRTYATAKNNFNVFDVTFEDEDGEEIETKSVNYGAKVTAPEAPEKDGFVFKGWYNGTEEFDFDSKITSVTTITAKYAEMVNYTVEVLVAQYSEGYGSGYYYPGTLSYVDKTSDYASFFNLDSNNQLKAEAGSVVSLAKQVATLQGAVKANAGSVLEATVEEDGSTKLTVKLDFDETKLGFGLDDIKIGEYSCSGLTFTLAYVDGVCGLAIDGTIGNGKELWITFDNGLTLADYSTIQLNYKEKSPTVNSQIAVMDASDVVSAYSSLVSATAPTNYVGGTTNILSKYSTVETIKAIRVKLLGGGQKNVFISGLELKGFKKETITYNSANGNLLNIAKGIGEYTSLAMEDTYHFGTTAVNALAYKYSQPITGGLHSAGVILDLGGIKVSDYKTVSLVFRQWGTKSDGSNNNGAVVYADGTKLNGDLVYYGGVQRIDLKALLQDAGVSVVDKVEISNPNWNNFAAYEIYVLEVVLELAD